MGGWIGGYIAGNNNPENPSWSRIWQYFDRFQNVLVLIYLLSCNEGIEIFLGCDLKVVDNSDFAVPLGWYSYIITFYKICSKSRPLLLTLIALNQDQDRHLFSHMLCCKYSMYCILVIFNFESAYVPMCIIYILLVYLLDISIKSSSLICKILHLSFTTSLISGGTQKLNVTAQNKAIYISFQMM